MTLKLNSASIFGYICLTKELSATAAQVTQASDIFQMKTRQINGNDLDEDNIPKQPCNI